MTSVSTYKQLLIAAIAVAVGFIFAGSPVHAQTIWDGSEPDDSWFTADNWDTGAAPNGASDQAVVGAPSPTVTNGHVVLQSLTVTADGVLTVSSGLNFNFATGAAVSLTNAGAITTLNGSDLQVLGMVDNTGSITITSTVSATDLEVAVGGATLTGGGTVTLTGPNAGINDFTGVQVLTIADQTIQGEGFIGRNGMNINNTAAGTILADVALGTLTIDTSSVNFANDGTLAVANDSTLSVTGDLIGSTTAALSGNGTIVATGGDILPCGSDQPRRVTGHAAAQCGPRAAVNFLALDRNWRHDARYRL